MAEMTRAEIGLELDGLADSVRREVYGLVLAYRQAQPVDQVPLIKQSIDSPQRARARLQEWMSSYDARNGAGAAQAFLAACLTAAGSSKTLADVNQELSALEAQAQNVVSQMQSGPWTWADAADWLESNLAPEPEPETFAYERLPLPAGYTTVWGEPG